MVPVRALINLIDRHRVMVRGSTGRRSKASRGRRRTPTGLEQPAPAPPGLYASKICAESERGARVDPEILPADRIEVIARPRHLFECCAAFSRRADRWHRRPAPDALLTTDAQGWGANCDRSFPMTDTAPTVRVWSVKFFRDLRSLTPTRLAYISRS
jgi:hypothetical protein